MRSLRSILLGCALALTVVVSSLIAGCTASVEGPPSTYTDSGYGFSFEYPSDWQVSSSADANVSGGAAPVAAVTVGDPEGARVDDTGLDIIMVRVYRLNAVVDESLLPEVLAELEPLVASLQAQDPSMVVEQPLTQTSVNGLPGFQFTSTFDWESGIPMRTTSYFLFSGDTEYQLVVQATQDRWSDNQEVFAAFLSTFQPGGSDD